MNNNIRVFPEISEKDKISWITNMWKLEGITLTEDQIQSAMFNPGKSANVFVTALIRCFDIMVNCAQNSSLLHTPNIVKEGSIELLFPWITRLHRNIIKTLFEGGEEVADYLQNLTEYEAGCWRNNEDVFIEELKACNPDDIEKKLIDLFVKVSAFHEKYSYQLDNNCIDFEDLSILSKEANDTSLMFAAIMPFEKYSHMIARMIENMLRMHFCLKIQTSYNKEYKKDVYRFARQNIKFL